MCERARERARARTRERAREREEGKTLGFKNRKREKPPTKHSARVIVFMYAAV